MVERHFQQEIEALEVTMMKMFSLTERSLDKAIRSLKNRDEDLAQEVIDEDKQLNAMEVEIEERTLNILALWQPVARDLRFVTACSRIGNELERIGDQSTNIAERVLLLIQKPRLDLMTGLESLADDALAMYRKVTNAYTKLDCGQAIEVCKMDSNIDDLTLKIMRKFLDFMVNESVIVERAVHAIIIANALERVADLSTNIGEDIVFIARGINVKHSDSFDSLCLD